MRSRTSRYALFDTRRNHRLAKYTGGTITSTPSASCHDMSTITMIAPTNRKMFCTNSTRPCEMSSCSASMSEVMRDDDATGLLRLEEVERQRHQVAEQPVAQLAEERLADASDQQDREAAEHDARGRHREIEHDGEVQRGRVVVARARGRCRTAPSAGPASSAAAWAMSTITMTAMRDRYGRSIRSSRRSTRSASSRDSVSSGTPSAQRPAAPHDATPRSIVVDVAGTAARAPRGSARSSRAARRACRRRRSGRRRAARRDPRARSSRGGGR